LVSAVPSIRKLSSDPFLDDALLSAEPEKPQMAADGAALGKFEQSAVGASRRFAGPFRVSRATACSGSSG
jgi:hypothetical protein